MADESTDATNDVNALPADLHALHDRLLHDGAAWRTKVAAGTGAREFQMGDAIGSPSNASSELHSEDAARRQQPRDMLHLNSLIERRQHIQEAPAMSDDLSTTTEQRPPAHYTAPSEPPNRRGGRVAALLTTAAVIALFVAVLNSFAPGRAPLGSTAPHTTVSVTATPTAVPTQSNNWTPLPALTEQAALPILGPSTASGVVIYQSSPTLLRRSDDGGQHWQQLPVPSAANNIMDSSVLVSPLDAQVAILEVTTSGAPSDLGYCPNPIASAPAHGGTLFSGQVPCTQHFRSTDGGAQWQSLHLGFPAVLGDKSPDSGGNGPSLPSTPLHAQGTTLYALLSCGPTCGGGSNGLAASSDGGATWRRIDGAFTARSLSVCNNLPTPNGTTLFVVASDKACDTQMSLPGNQSLWRSDDAGAHWAQTALPPNRSASDAVRGAVVTANAAGASTLFVNMQPVQFQPHQGTLANGPAVLFMTHDGGNSWSAAPTAGVPSGTFSPTGPAAVLADGSIVEPFAQPYTIGQAPTDAQIIYYQLSPNATTWKAITGALNASLLSFDVRTFGKQETFFAVTLAGYTNSGPLYTVQTCVPSLGA